VRTSGVGEIARRVFVEDLDIGGETSTRVIPLDQIMREKRVLGEAPARRALERIDVICAFAGEAPLAEEVLVDIGYRGRIGVDPWVP
jgi:hypothetical protein